MAVRIALATGNFLTASTWGTIDATSYTSGENAATVLPTSYGTACRTVSTTPGAITIRGIGVKLNVRTGTTGTMTVHLATAADHVEVSGTAVTINTADLPAAVAADINGGWIYFKFAGDVTLAGATTYEVEAKTSSGSQVSLWRTDGTVGNVAIFLQTTTTGAPVAGDDLIITGIHTTTGAPAAVTVTMDETATTDYGAGSTSLVTPSLAIGNSGTLTYGTTAATNYYLRQSGNVIVYAGGTLNMGTTGTPMPRNSSAVLNFDSAVNVDFGLTVRNLGTFNAQGLSRTSGKNVVSCKLNADSPVNDTVLDVDTDTGWLDNDEIAVASTSRTAADCEAGTINVTVTATQLTVDGFAGVGGGLAVAHSGTSPTQAEVILLTRNVQIFGASTSLQGYVDIKATATIDCDWTEFKWLGSATSNKRGIDLATTTGSVSFQYCALHDFGISSSIGVNFTGASGSAWTFSNNVTWKIASIHFQVAATSGTTWTADTNVFIRNTSNALVILSDVGGTFTNITTVGATLQGVSIGESAITGTISNLTSHSNTDVGIAMGNAGTQGTLTTLACWRNAATGFGNSASMPDLTISGLTAFGNTTSNFDFLAAAGRLALVSPVFNGDSTFATTNGIRVSNVPVGELIILNGNFGTVSGIKTAHTNDITITTAGYVRAMLNNTILASGTELSGQTLLTPNSFISSQKHDQTAGNHKTWKKYGTISIDTTANMFRTASPSERLTPNNASNKLTSSTKQATAANGAAVTPSVYVRESVAGDGTDYNGARVRLIVKRNDAVGITADTVLATATVASEGAWQLLTAATAKATDDGVMEFYIDCDGTTGWVNLDDWSVA